MSAKGCIGVSQFGTVSDNFYNVDWLASTDVSYNLATNHTTYEARDITIISIYIMQHKDISQAYTRVHMMPEDIKDNRTRPNEVRCKFDTAAGAHVKPISVFRRLCPAVFDFTEKSLEKLDSDWNSPLTHGATTIKQFELRGIKGIF